MRIGRVLGAVAFLLLGAMPFYAQEVLTLDEAVTMAVAHNRTVQRGALGPERAEEQLAAARTQRLPQFEITAFGGELLNHLSVSLPGSNGAPLSLSSAERPLTLVLAQASMPLTQQYKIGLGLKNIALEKQLKTEEARNIRADVIAQVKAAYYKIALSEFDLKAAEFNTQVCREVERVTSRYYNEKAVLRSEFLDVQARRARAEYQVSVLRDKLAEQKESMNSLLGRSIDVDFAVAPIEEVPVDSADPAGLQVQALAVNPLVREARIKLDQARVAERIKTAEYIPDISLSMNYLSITGLPTLFPQKIAAAGVFIDWKPFDWGRKRHESAELARTAKEKELSLKEEEDRIRIAVRAQVRRLNEARQLIAAARINQERAQEDVRVMQVRYSTNAILMKNILESQASAAAAYAETHKAMTDYWEAMTDLDKLMGVK